MITYYILHIIIHYTLYTTLMSSSYNYSNNIFAFTYYLLIFYFLKLLELKEYENDIFNFVLRASTQP